MDKRIDLQEFISTIKNRTNEKSNGLLLMHEGKPVPVIMTYEDYLNL